MRVVIYCLGYKAYKAISGLDDSLIKAIDCLIIAKDKNVVNDYSNEIEELAIEKKIEYKLRSPNYSAPNSLYHIAIGWRWLIKIVDGGQLIVMHDSLLPKYRGFNPLPTALINGDRELGVTALFGTEDYDTGNIICQSSIKINYPIKVNTAIELLGDIYTVLLQNVLEDILLKGRLSSVKQNEQLASYSLWRDEDDYFIPWEKDANYIKRFIDSIGFPYKGASCYCGNSLIRIDDVTIIPDLFISNRTPGKSIKQEDGKPIIVCGTGLLKIERAKYDNGEDFVFNNFRIRLKNDTI